MGMNGEALKPYCTLILLRHRGTTNSMDQNWGQRLLRVLGWKDPDSVSTEETDSLFHHHTKQQQVGSLVSRDQLRKLHKQQRVPIPEPKIDTAGLGMEPLENALEFVHDRIGKMHPMLLHPWKHCTISLGPNQWEALRCETMSMILTTTTTITTTTELYYHRPRTKYTLTEKRFLPCLMNTILLFRQ